MPTVQEVYSFIDSLAPFATQAEWDNGGLQCGNPHAQVATLLLALDVTAPVLEEAGRLGAELIVTHHPLIFTPARAILAESLLYQAIRGGVAVLSAHTSLDVSPYGVNHALAQALQLTKLAPLELHRRDFYPPQNPPKAALFANPQDARHLSLGLVGSLPQPLAPQELAGRVCEQLACPGLRLLAAGAPIQRLAVCGGSGGSLVRAAVAAGAQALLTGDMKHDVLLEAAHCGLALLDAGHYTTERPVLPVLAALLTQHFPGLRCHLSKADYPELQFIT